MISSQDKKKLCVYWRDVYFGGANEYYFASFRKGERVGYVSIEERIDDHLRHSLIGVHIDRSNVSQEEIEELRRNVQSSLKIYK